jgi:heavy metal translocating P-type ATPase
VTEKPRSALAEYRRVVPLVIAGIAFAGIAAHLVLRFVLQWPGPATHLPLFAVLVLGGVPLVFSLIAKLARGDIGADLLAGISIVTATALGEYLAGAIVVLMLAGGEALEQFALRRASSVLRALAARMPSIAHRKSAGGIEPMAIDAVAPGDELVVLPHEVCPVDGVVVAGHGPMDESYLTGEPYVMSKAPGSEVLSGAVNGENALTIRATRRADDSRYSKIMDVMRRTEESRPRLRRLGDRLGAFYTPLAIVVAVIAYVVSGSATRALSVLVVATPCPLILAIPVAIIGGISLAARRGIVVRDPAVLERLDTCRTVIFDKTGTLTYGRPVLTQVVLTGTLTRSETLALAASVEQYSKHPLAAAVVTAAREEGITIGAPDEIAEPPGRGLTGSVDGRRIELTGRKSVAARNREMATLLPASVAGLEAVMLVDGSLAAVLRFRDEPREDSRSLVQHLAPRHGVKRVMLVSGDRVAEVEDLGHRIGITEILGGQSPEDKVRIVREEMAKAPTMFVGDGINDAPALAAATVGLAFGRGSDIIAEAAGAVLLDTSLVKVDELLHIARRLRRIALESAVLGMTLSAIGMGFAAAGFLSPVVGALLQEMIDVLAISNALRASQSPARLHDYAR